MSLRELCRSVLEEVIDEQEIINPSYEVSSGSKPGDGYLGIHAIAKIVGKNKTLSVFIKLAPANEEFRKQEAVGKGFLNECLFYKIIAPTLMDFEEEKGSKIRFEAIPKCYKVINREFKETIVLENLWESGYSLLDRINSMPSDHVEMVLKEFAHFHALCYALKDQKRTVFDAIIRGVSHPFDSYANREEFKQLFDYLVDGVKEGLDCVEDKDVCDIFDRFAEEIIPFLIHTESLSTDESSIILHADGWCNNFMFKYEDMKNPTKPTKIQILDWQMLKISPPVFDISYFFYCSCGKKEMDNLEYYLLLYHDSLSSNLRMLGSDPDILYPYSKFKDHWRKYSRYGLILALLVIKNVLTESDEVELLDKVMADGKNMCEVFMFRIRKDKIYKERIRDVIVHFVKNGFLDFLEMV